MSSAERPVPVSEPFGLPMRRCSLVPTPERGNEDNSQNRRTHAKARVRTFWFADTSLLGILKRRFTAAPASNEAD
jgi:hypothetical protein